MKKFLIINQHAPLDHLYTEEILELALSIASIGNTVDLLLLDMANWQIFLANNPNLQLLRPTLIKILTALNFFEFEKIYIKEPYLLRFKTLEPALPKNFHAYNLKELNGLLKKYEVIL